MDETIQNTIEDVFSDSSIMPKIRHYDASGTPQPQAAAVLIDFRTGAVKGIMGWKRKSERCQAIKPRNNVCTPAWLCHKTNC